MTDTNFISKFSMRIQCDDGTVKIRELVETVDEEEFCESLVDFVFNHIGHAFIFDDFSRTIVEWRLEDVQYRKSFESLEAMRKWYLSII